MNTSEKMTISGLLMGLIGIIIAIEFLSVDASLFGTVAPEWIQNLSNSLPLNGFDLDLLMTIDMILLILEFKWQGEK